MTDVGCLFTFEVDPSDNSGTEQVIKKIFASMAEEEFPTGHVKTYTAYRAPQYPGHWVSSSTSPLNDPDATHLGPKCSMSA
jgi:5,10-methylenetetrahydrofolate reductase